MKVLFVFTLASVVINGVRSSDIIDSRFYYKNIVFCNIKTFN